MAIVAADLKLYRSTNDLGGAITATESLTNVSGNIFDTFSGAETSAGGVFYGCLYLKNEHASLTAQALEMLIESETDHAGINFSLAVGTSAVDAVEQSITDENTAPTGVTFTDTDTTTVGATSADPTINLPNLPNGSTIAIWVKCTIDAATAAVTGYAANVGFNFDTAA